MYALGYPLLSAATILDYLLVIYVLIILAVIVLSWTNPDPLNPIVRTLRNLVEPVFDRVRPYVPLISGLDLTPMVVIVAIIFIRNGILKVIIHFAWEITN